MGKQGNNRDPTAATSSIALLQERFRELQRVKEKREERELMKRFTGSTRPVSTSMMINTTPRMTPPREHHSLSLGLDSQRTAFQNRADLQTANGLESGQSLWSRNGTGGGTASRSFENSDVDTSLRL